MSRLTRPINLLDQCALALPCGFTQSGLPISMQVVGRGYDEARVLRIGWAYENATEWHARRPPHL
jgi:aspartyl-tRNA(Asn)/glutamyl-tRNA(Gln) amidotransferase subunit A